MILLLLLFLTSSVHSELRCVVKEFDGFIHESSVFNVQNSSAAFCEYKTENAIETISVITDLNVTINKTTVYRLANNEFMLSTAIFYSLPNDNLLAFNESSKNIICKVKNETCLININIHFDPFYDSNISNEQNFFFSDHAVIQCPIRFPSLSNYHLKWKIENKTISVSNILEINSIDYSYDNIVFSCQLFNNSNIVLESFVTIHILSLNLYSLSYTLISFVFFIFTTIFYVISYFYYFKPEMETIETSV